jgi:hypothetical protein
MLIKIVSGDRKIVDIKHTYIPLPRYRAIASRGLPEFQ